MFSSGDKVRVTDNEFYRLHAIDEGLDLNKTYEVERVNYGVDGAYDFDEVYLIGRKGWVCEFLLEKVK